jgi:predicted phosphate transport protein (TIGR00153 family)
MPNDTMAVVPSTSCEELVRLNLTPRETVFYDMFAASADNLVEGANLLDRMVTGPRSERAELASALQDAEHRGDHRTQDILRQLNATFVTPFDREDIYRLAGRLDDVMDFLEAAGDLILLYELEALPRELQEMCQILVRAAELTSAAMPRLRTLADLSDFWVSINQLENQADKLFRRFVAQLFKGDIEPLMVMKLKEVAEQIEAAADAFERVADTVETIAVKES